MYVSTRSRRGMGDANPLTVGVSAGVGLAVGAAGLWMNSIKLSNDAKTATTQIVNGLEPLLRQNVDAYMAGPRTCADQAAALAAFDTAWLWLQSPAACGRPGYGSAGNRCITDRDRGGQWPWPAYYRDPIANDPEAAGCAAAIAGTNAAESSAIANIQALVSGNPIQTTAGQFVGPSGEILSSGNLATDLATAVSGIPTWAWLAAAGLAAIVVLK